MILVFKQIIRMISNHFPQAKGKCKCGECTVSDALNHFECKIDWVREQEIMVKVMVQIMGQKCMCTMVN